MGKLKTCSSYVYLYHNRVNPIAFAYSASDMLGSCPICLPSQCMVHYVLVRLQGAAAILAQTITYCLHAYQYPTTHRSCLLESERKKRDNHMCMWDN